MASCCFPGMLVCCTRQERGAPVLCRRHKSPPAAAGFSVPAVSRTAASQGGFFPPNPPVYRPKRQRIESNFDRGKEEPILPSFSYCSLSKIML